MMQYVPIVESHTSVLTPIDSNTINFSFDMYRNLMLTFILFQDYNMSTEKRGLLMCSS